MPTIKAHVAVCMDGALRTSPCTAWENAVWAANNSSKEGRTEDVEGVEARLGRCQDTTRRVMRPAMARGEFGRELRSQFWVLRLWPCQTAIQSYPAA